MLLLETSPSDEIGLLDPAARLTDILGLDDDDDAATKENVVYSFPSRESLADDGDTDSSAPPPPPPLVVELIPLPYLSKSYEQMPVGARGWYASAMLSAMMMVSYGNTGGGNLERSSDDASVSATELMGKDLEAACRGNHTMVELGSGTLGLVGLTMAWIASQHKKHPENAAKAASTVYMTDYDRVCLAQLERNVSGVRQRLREYYTNEQQERRLPIMEVAHMDWNEYDLDQSPVLPEINEIANDDIALVAGAALVYMESTAACVDQVLKILTRNPRASVWVVQWPRNGWFSVFRQELLRQKYRSEGLRPAVQTFGPTNAPDLFSNRVQALAQTLLPACRHMETPLRLRDLKAVRITNAVGAAV